ncbi:unnamed protein product [Tuber aestivum]|uniref:Uncharacterized protein n=1 Tax=Tuber aestivum TaxID=59557 RepID=A0A292PQ27_9PEZI|nr:unnamed protein product [Tuber aestivum]
MPRKTIISLQVLHKKSLDAISDSETSISASSDYHTAVSTIPPPQRPGETALSQDTNLSCTSPQVYNGSTQKYERIILYKHDDAHFAISVEPREEKKTLLFIPPGARSLGRSGAHLNPFPHPLIIPPPHSTKLYNNRSSGKATAPSVRRSGMTQESKAENRFNDSMKRTGKKRKAKNADLAKLFFYKTILPC